MEGAIIMTNEQRTRLSQHIMLCATTAYEYGRNDCFTFPMQWHDIRQGTSEADKLAKKYDTKLSAARYFRNQVSPESWLAHRGYQQVETPSDGDYVIVSERNWPLVMIVMDGCVFWQDESKLIRVPLSLITPDSIWRI
jgi:hypothetical protein